MVSKKFNVADFSNWADRSADEISSTAESILTSTIDEAAFFMRETIMTTGTNKDWGRSWPSRAQGRKSGSTEARFDTGEMRDSVKHRVLRSSKRFVSGEFGWLDNQQDYFKFQDNGFTHRNGAVIPAMNALRDAFTYAVTTVDDKLKKAFRK
jgi:hypothetical protein